MRQRHSFCCAEWSATHCRHNINTDIARQDTLRMAPFVSPLITPDYCSHTYLCWRATDAAETMTDAAESWPIKRHSNSAHGTRRPVIQLFRFRCSPINWSTLRSCVHANSPRLFICLCACVPPNHLAWPLSCMENDRDCARQQDLLVCALFSRSQATSFALPPKPFCFNWPVVCYVIGNMFY